MGTRGWHQTVGSWRSRHLAVQCPTHTSCIVWGHREQRRGIMASATGLTFYLSNNVRTRNVSSSIRLWHGRCAAALRASGAHARRLAPAPTAPQAPRPRLRRVVILWGRQQAPN